jgi:flagellar protein FlbD
MICLTRLNGQPIAVNSDLIKFVENAHDTVLTLLNGEKVIVRESTEDVIQRIIEFRRLLFAGLPADSPIPEVDSTLQQHIGRAASPDLTPEKNRRG